MDKEYSSNGYMTLKIELAPAKIVRTIVVPEHMTLQDLHDAIQAVMGWENAHLWHFMDNRRDGVIYELPNDKDEDFLPFSKRLTVDASSIRLRSVFPRRGAKLYYEYDFGDGWEHVVTRQADPKTPEIACLKSLGPDGIEDFGGPWRLADFIAAMRTHPKDSNYADLREWHCLSTAEELSRFLAGETAEEKTRKLRDALAHVKPEERPDATPSSPMTEDNKANALGMIFATMVNERLWKILEDALRNGGTCEFEDPDKDIGEFFLTKFEGLKVKDGRSTIFFTAPSRLTVWPQWVEMYKSHGDDWRALHEQFDILEEYAASAVGLYGVVSLEELNELVLRYDPGFSLSMDAASRMLEARSVNCPKMPFRIDSGLVVSEDMFPMDVKNINDNIADFRECQSENPRWYPETREDLFDWQDADSFETTPESNHVEHLLEAACKANADYNATASLFAFYHLLALPVPPTDAFDSIRKHDYLPKLGEKPKRVLIDALERWQQVIHIALFNGNTPQNLRGRT